MLVKRNIVGFEILLLCSCAGQILAGTHEFGSGSFEFSIEFVAVGDAGNRADEDGWYPGDALATAPGRVEYPFEIAKYEEIESNIDNAIVGGLAVKIDQRGPNAPVTAVTFEEAARYANWLNSSSGFAEAYKFDGVDVVDWSPEDVGYDPNNPTRNRFAKYALPTHDEWYKAAYYDAETESYFDYPTGSNTPPVSTTFGTSAGTAVFGGLVEGPVPPVGAGGVSPYGTVGQGGNVSEWLETPSLRVNVGSRFVRGGDFLSDAIGLEARTFGLGAPQSENSALGFRIVSVPEPSSWLIALIGVAAVPMVCRRRSG